MVAQLRTSWNHPLDEFAASDPFELTIGNIRWPDVRVVRLVGKEGLSQLYSFDVTFRTAAAPSTAFAVGSPATLTIPGEHKTPRVVRGIAARVRADGAALEEGLGQYRIRIAPLAERLRHRRATRVFQGKRANEIVDLVLGEHRVPRRWSLTRECPVRAYSLQYQETDWDFVTRLLAEEGLFHWFEPTPASGDDEPRDQIAIGDDPSAYVPLGGEHALEFREHANFAAPGSSIHTLNRTTRLRPHAVHLRDFDFCRPAVRLDETAVSDLPAEAHLEIYDHHGEYEEADIGRGRAARLLDRHRADARTLAGTSDCRALAPGRRFHLLDQVRGTFDGEYVVTRVVHRGVAPEYVRSGARHPVYENRFECAPAHVAVRPRPAPRAPRQVLESATVVGPPNEEIFTDAHGRIKVQFHWDRAGGLDEHSSCWIRVAQAWAGAQHGMQLIPRVGSEVLVAFIGGDPDRPVVIGSVHNGRHPTPFPLPRQKARSGLRSASTPGGAGYSELSIDDTCGAEVVRIRAQRDLETVVLGDRACEVGRDDRLDVAGDQRWRIEGDRRLTVEGGDLVTVRGQASLDVGGDRVESFGGEERVHVAAASVKTVGGSVRAFVGGDVHRQTRGTESVRVEGDAVTHVRGHVLHTVERDSSFHVTGDLVASVGEEHDPRSASLDVRGGLHAAASGAIALSAVAGITLRCGETTLSITEEGVKIEGRALTLVAKETLTLGADGPALTLAKEAELVAPAMTFLARGGSLVLDGNASLRGEKVRLNPNDRPSRAGGGSGAAAPRTKKLHVVLADYDFKPYAEKRYRLSVDGLVIEGTTGADGSVDEHVPADARTASLILWTDVYPMGPKERYALSLEDLPDADSTRGAQVRLKNLGYYVGPTDGEMHDSFRRALVAFQTEQGVEPSAVPDAETTAAIRRVHGA